MDHIVGLGDPNGAQYYPTEQSYGSNQVYGGELSAYNEANGELGYDCVHAVWITCGIVKSEEKEDRHRRSPSKKKKRKRSRSRERRRSRSRSPGRKRSRSRERRRSRSRERRRRK